MAKGISSKNNWALFLLVLAGIVLGGFIGTLAVGVPALSWLNYGKTFGLTSPFVFDIGILALSLGFTIQINIASIIGVLLAIIIYRRL